MLRFVVILIIIIIDLVLTRTYQAGGETRKETDTR